VTPASATWRTPSTSSRVTSTHEPSGLDSVAALHQPTNTVGDFVGQVGQLVRQRRHSPCASRRSCSRSPHRSLPRSSGNTVARVLCHRAGSAGCGCRPRRRRYRLNA
jgi:hypothetical protein